MRPILAALLMTITSALAWCHSDRLDARQTRLIDLALHPYDHRDAPGVAVGVVRGGEFVYRRAVGMADLERAVPLAPDSVFFVASVTKQFTAMCILLLEEQGKLKLDDPVRKHVPELPEYLTAPTIRHLLNHTSGVRDYYSLNTLKGIDIESYYNDDDVLAMICRQKDLNFKPGDKYMYSNSGYFLLKTIVERASKTTIQAFAKEHIFDPLGMANTQYQKGVNMLVPGRALAYGGSIEAGFSNAHNSDAVVGTRGMLTTIDDFAKWFGNFKRNKLGKGRQDLIQRLTTTVPLNDGTPATYACGVTVREVRGVKRIAHSGFFAGYRTRVNYYPDADTMTFVFANSYAINPDTLSDRVEELVLADKLEPIKPAEKPRPAKPVAAQPQDLLGATGVYMDDDGVLLEVTAADSGLVVVTETAVQRRLEPEGANDYYDPKTGDVLKFQNGVLVVTPREGKPQSFTRQPRMRRAKEELGALVGRYWSDEVEAEHRLEVDGDALVLKVYDDRHVLVPLPNGHFSCSLGRIEFAPDGRSYTVHGSRVRRMTFGKRA